MNDFDFTFEETPWELFAEKLCMGDTLSAARFLTLLEGENEQVVEDAFQTLEDLSVTLDVSDLPKTYGTGDTAVRLRREEQLVRQGSLLTALEQNDPLRLYLEELASIPVCGDVRELAVELAEVNRKERTDDPVQMKLLNMSLSRLVQLAAEYTGRGVMLMDLIQEGSLGLWQCILSYVENLDFEAVRDWWVRQSMAKAVTLQARQSGVGQKMRQALEDYRAVDERLLGDLGRNATIEEIALELHMTVEEAEAVRNMMDSARMMNRTRTENEPKEETEDDERHVEDTAYFQMRQRITELLSVLKPEDADPAIRPGGRTAYES